MSTTTTKFKLVKPALTDSADITAMNSNWDTIDELLGATGKFDAIKIEASTDLNTLTTAGVYYCGTNVDAASLTNSPTAEAFAMVVYQTASISNAVLQLVYEYRPNDTRKQYFRTGQGGTWSSWGSNYTTANPPTKSTVGLGNVDNTSDASKPISTATQTALNGKQATVTGAATTITTNNLTADRAVISNGDGKVAVSAVTSTELGYLAGVTSNIQSQLNSKQGTVSGGASSIISSDLTANRALVSNANGKVGVSNVTATEVGYLSGVTSNIQTQINNKLSLTGGNLTGSIDVISDDSKGIGKRRTINGTQYLVNYGCGILGGKGVASVELQQGDTVLGRIEIGDLGVSYVDSSGKRTYLHRISVASATLE